MSRAIITESILSRIADAIRVKLDTDAASTYRPGEMAQAILSIGGTPNGHLFTSSATGRNDHAQKTVTVNYTMNLSWATTSGEVGE